MKEGTCIKCGSNEVYVSENVWGQRGGFDNNTIPVTLLSDAVLENYVCAQCGYVESYVRDASKREKIRKKWPRVGSVQRR